MGKIKLSRFDFNDYRGAEQISLIKGVSAPDYYLDEVSTDSSNNVYLIENEYDDFNYSLTTEGSDDNIYFNETIAGMCRELTNLTVTDLINKSKFNYHYVTNMHTTYANCYKLVDRPISGSNVRSMYGTYYNCTNLTYGPQSAENTNNLIGTYYNCTNLTTLSTMTAYNNVNMMIGTYYNCINLSGRPIASLNARSIEDCYYNCYNIYGNPANCNNAIITINAYYNCPRINGTFYWYEKNYSQADIINATNMFYNRNRSTRLNIYVKPGTSVENALLNYSGTYGNIYGVGPLTWTRLANNNGYVNSYYNTYILYYNVKPIISIGSYIEGNFINDYETPYPVYTSSSPGYTYENFRIFARTYSGIFTDADLIPEGYASVSTLNATHNIKIYAKWLNYNLATISPNNVNLACYDSVNIRDFIIYTNNINPSDIELRSFLPQHFAISRKKDLDIYPEFFNIFNLNITAFNDKYVELYKNNQNIINPVFSINATNLDNAFIYNVNKEEQYNWRWYNTILYRINDITNVDERYNYSNTYYYRWRNLRDNGANHKKLLDFMTNNLPFMQSPPDLQIIPKCPSRVTSMCSTYKNFILAGPPVCGPNVLFMNNTYNNCRNIEDRAYCGPNVLNYDYCYYNTDVTRPYYGPNIQSANYTFSHTLITDENIFFPASMYRCHPWMVGLFDNCQLLYTISNINIPQYTGTASTDFVAIFKNCRHLCFDADQRDQLPVGLWDYNSAYKDCHNLIEGLRLNNNMILDWDYDNDYDIGAPSVFENCYNLSYIDETLFARMRESSNIYANCYNLRTGLSYCHNTVETHFEWTFANCINLVGDCDFYLNHFGLYNNANYNGIVVTDMQIFNFTFSKPFYNCQSINTINLTINAELAQRNHNGYKIGMAAIFSNDSEFYNCTNLYSITVNTKEFCNNFFTYFSSSSSACNYLFFNCTNLVYVHLSSADPFKTLNVNMWDQRRIGNTFISQFGRNVFYNCQNLIDYSYVVANNETNRLFGDILALNNDSWCDFSFYNCKNLVSINFKIVTNGTHRFYDSFLNCSNLKYLTFNSQGVLSYSDINTELNTRNSYETIFNQSTYFYFSQQSILNCRNLEYITLKNVFGGLYEPHDLYYMNLTKDIYLHFNSSFHTPEEDNNFLPNLKYLISFNDDEKNYIYVNFVFHTYGANNDYNYFLSQNNVLNLIDLAPVKYGISFYSSLNNYYDNGLNNQIFYGGSQEFNNLTYLSFEHSTVGGVYYQDNSIGTENVFINCNLYNLNHIRFSRGYNVTNNETIFYKDLSLFYQCNTSTTLNKLELVISQSPLNVSTWIFNRVLKGTQYENINYLILKDYTNLNYQTSSSSYYTNRYYPANNTALLDLEKIFADPILNNINYNTLVIPTNHSGMQSLMLTRLNYNCINSYFGYASTSSGLAYGYYQDTITKTFRTFNNRFNRVLIGDISLPYYWYGVSWLDVTRTQYTQFLATVNFENIIGFFVNDISLNFGEKTLENISEITRVPMVLNRPKLVDFNNAYSFTALNSIVKYHNGAIHSSNNYLSPFSGALQIALVGGESGNSAYFGPLVFDTKTRTSLCCINDIDLNYMQYTNDENNYYRVTGEYDLFDTRYFYPYWMHQYDSNSLNYNLNYNLIQVTWKNTTRNISVTWYEAELEYTHKYR